MAAWLEGTVESNGIHLHYTRTGGDKAPMVLVHGLTGNRLVWKRLARILEPTYDVIMVDARGHGLSDKPESGYSPLDHVRDLAGVIEALQLGRTAVMGHSMGGVTASWLAADYPELVSAIILEDPVWYWPRSAEQNETDKHAVYEQWHKRLTYRKTLSTADGHARGWRERPLYSAEDLDAEVESKEQVSMHVLDYLLLHEPTWAQQVSKFESPVLLIYGEPSLGSIVGADVASEARRINELVEPRQIPGTGHSIHTEQLDEFVAVVREFLARVRRAAAQATPRLEAQH